MAYSGTALTCHLFVTVRFYSCKIIQSSRRGDEQLVSLQKNPKVFHSREQLEGVTAKGPVDKQQINLQVFQ